MQFSRSDVTFSSGGLDCAAWLYLPQGVERPPVVVMGHGFAGLRTFGMEPYAERFAAAGMAALVFDYRHWGDSPGEPRQLVSVGRQLEDWRAAMDWARACPQVDGGRMALWGSSFSGGHVITLAAGDGRVSAVVAQVPFVDGISSARELGMGFVLKAALAGLRDMGRMLTGREPYYMQVVGDPGELAFLNTPDAKQGYFVLVPPGSNWENKFAARLCLTVAMYRPVTQAAKVACPMLLMPATGDTLIPVRSVRKVAERAPRATLREMDCKHFEPYHGELFEKAVTEQTEFLQQSLGA